MKDSDLHRLLKYDQSSEFNHHQNYFCRLPTTLLYPHVTRTDIEAYIETIEREYLTPLDLQTWQHMKLFLLEPEWLQSSEQRKLRLRFYAQFSSNQQFVHNIIEQYSHLSLFSENIEKQESLFFTVCGLLQIAEQTKQLHHTIVQFKNTLIQEIKSKPTDWTAFIKGADWLFEELQQESGLLINFLQQVSMLSLPFKEPTDMVQQSMNMWVDSASEEGLQSTDKNLNRINDMLKNVLNDITASKKPTNKT